MDPTSLDELLGAYALDALDADERLAVEEYLVISPRARAEVHEHRDVATVLAWSGTAAPEGLWDRIASTLDETAPRPGPELARVMPMVGRRPWMTRPARWAVTATAAAVVVGIVAAVAVRLTGDNEGPRDPIAAAVEDARNDRDSMVLELSSEDGQMSAEVIVDQDGHGYLMAGSLPALGADRTYQLWGLVDGKVISLGVLGHNPETEMFAVEGDLAAIMITEEVAGGVPQSTNPAMLSATL